MLEEKKMFINVLVKLREVPVVGKLSFYLLKFLGIEIPLTVRVGKNVEFAHWAYGLVVHPNTIIEDNVKLYQGVTIGRSDIYEHHSKSKMESIVIRKGAIICAGAKVLCKEGVLSVGENTVIGANAVLFSSTGDNEIWVGSPAKKIKSR
jgi:serine O-acetyltransferase